MKAQIVGIVLVLLVLGALFVLTEGDFSGSTTAPAVSTPSTNDSAFKDLKIN
jgi:hypothetical protein